MAELLSALVLILLCVVIIHEAGHWFAAIALGIPARPFFDRRGIGFLVGSDSIRLTRRQIGVTASAGPAANLAAAALAYGMGYGWFVLPNLLFAVANLIPFPSSDGQRILRGYGEIGGVQ